LLKRFLPVTPTGEGQKFLSVNQEDFMPRPFLSHWSLLSLPISSLRLIPCRPFTRLPRNPL
jgi:hypothetical protein